MFIAVLSIDWGTQATALVMSIVAARAPLLPKYSLVLGILSLKKTFSSLRILCLLRGHVNQLGEAEARRTERTLTGVP